jgi:hypothetical protein
MDFLQDAGLVGERTLDTIEDAVLHLRRTFEKPKRVTLPSKSDKPRAVVIGAGWAAHAIIKIIDTELYDVVVISPRNVSSWIVLR